MNEEPKNSLGLAFRSLQAKIEHIKERQLEIAKLESEKLKDKEDLEQIKGLIQEIEKNL